VRRGHRGRAPRRRGLLALGCALAAVAATLALHAPARTRADASGPLVAQPVLGVPDPTMLGSTPAETPGEAWAAGAADGELARYTPDAGWQAVTAPAGTDGQPIPDLSFATGALAGRTTAHGGVAIAAQSGAGQGATQLLVVRDPGGPFRAAPAPPAGGPGALLAGESLYDDGNGAHPLLTALDETGGRTGALVVPATTTPVLQTAVLHYDGSAWSREPICFGAAPACQAPSGVFKVLAIDAGSPQHAWLLARGPSSSDGIVLLDRETVGGQPQWRQRTPAGTPGALWAQAAPAIPHDPSAPAPPSVRIGPRTTGQPLTATDDGASVWVDAQLTVGTTKLDATLRYTPGAANPGDQVVSWCDAPPAVAVLCSHPLGTDLPAADGRSFAWSGGGPSGERVITGIGAGAYLTLQGDAFVRVATVGGDAGSSDGAAFESPDEGWLGAPGEAVHVTRAPEPSRLQPWPVPFRRPLTAIAAQPGAAPGSLGSQALAVGDAGQVARYTPGAGWVPEFLLAPSGARATPRLRGVAWPEPDRAYAVGDNAEMWLWRRDTGLWEPDPAKPPNLALVNLTGIAFDPGDPQRGYAIGKQGLLLAYGKEWTQEPLPAGVDPQANFSSIAFAGHQALATYKLPRPSGVYVGGLIENDGSGWHADDGAVAALGGSAPERVAGLPDGGAVVASIDGKVAERDGPGAPWTAVAPLGSFPVALAAIREAGHVGAVASVEFGGISSPEADWQIDSDQLFIHPPAGQAPLVTAPYPFASEGHVLRQDAAGWHDEEHEAFPRPRHATGDAADWPLRPDAVLAFLLDPSGAAGWAVGGETGVASRLQGSTVQTAGVMRYPADGAPPPAGTAHAPIATVPGTASFAIGGNAQCADACADLANTDIGPEVWLPAAVAQARGVAGLRAFLYTGPGIADGLAGKLDGDAFALESERYAARLSAAAGDLPVFAAPAGSDRDGSGSLATFARAFAGFDAPLGSRSPDRGISPVAPMAPGGGSYAFDSGGAEGTVRVIVLDASASVLGAAQDCWLAQELAGASAAGAPAIVIGDRDLRSAPDASLVESILVTGAPPGGCTVSGSPAGASAYFFDAPQQNLTFAITSGGRSMPAFGSGTLGYVNAPQADQTDFVGASGFLLAAVDVAHRDAATNVAPVGVRLIPAISDLALDAADGTLLRRSQPALFDALARRPRAGMLCRGLSTGCTFAPDPYIPIPSRCQGPGCATGLLPDYRFTSSHPDIADFVRQDPASTNPRHVLLGAHDKPIPDATSGLLCAFNAGTTTVTVTTGGLSYSQQVTVQAGSAQRPCGTVPLLNPPARPTAPAVTPPPLEQSPQPGLHGGSTPLPPPPAPAPHAVKHPHPQPARAVAALPFFAVAPSLTQVIPALPPPAPTAARPIPPSGTASAQVYQSAVAPERQREEERALDLVHSMALHRRPADGPNVPAYLPALVLLAAVGGATVRGGRRRRSCEARLALASVSRNSSSQR
jgi:hypothetical protein